VNSRAVAAVALAVSALSACKGDEKLTSYTLAPDAGTAPGYEPGTPVTLADGTFVTLPDGTKVTTPTIPANRERRTTTSEAGAAPGATAAPTTNTTYLATTGTTTKKPAPTDALGIPANGVYTFHETLVRDDGSEGADRDLGFTYSRSAPTVVRVTENNPDGAPRTGSYYEERHDDDGLWLATSAVSDGVCRWEPKSALLSRAVIEGGSTTTEASCKAGETTLRLTTTVAFRSVRQVTIGGKEYRCIDVTRNRVLTDGTTKITSQAVDTYSFELGMRVATSEHATTEAEESVTGYTRTLILVSLPS
jgi:hypothetical protein